MQYKRRQKRPVGDDPPFWMQVLLAVAAALVGYAYIVIILSL